MEMPEIITRYQKLMEKLKEMHLPQRPFSEWLKAVQDFDDTPLKRRKIILEK